MKLKLYGMDVSYGRISLQSTEVVRETAKMYYLSNARLGVFDYCSQLRKDDTRAQCKTAQEAIEKARLELNQGVFHMERKLEEAKEHLSKFEDWADEYEEEAE